jgi:hypothetical protein
MFTRTVVAGGPVSDASRQAIVDARKGEFGEARVLTSDAFLALVQARAR